MNRNKINMMVAEILANKGWEKAFNELEEEFLIKSMDRLIEHLDFRDKQFNQYYIDIFRIKEGIEPLWNLMHDDENLVEFGEITNKYNRELSELQVGYKKALDNVLEDYKQSSTDLNDYQLAFDSELTFYTSTQEVNTNILFARVTISQNKMNSILHLLDLNDLQIENEFNEVRNDLKFFVRYFCRRVDKLEEEYKNIKVKEKKNKYKKIFHYKDMISLAENNGFILQRTSGDHFIYYNSELNRTAIIPAHTQMKYGTMLNCQKMIYGEVRQIQYNNDDTNDVELANAYKEAKNNYKIV